MQEEIESKSSEIKISNRNYLTMSGIKKIDEFDKTEFTIHTVLGSLVLKGDNLELLNLDVKSGNITIKGTINSLSYNEENHKNKDSFISRLLK